MNWFKTSQLANILDIQYPKIKDIISEDKDNVTINISNLKYNSNISAPNVIAYVKNYAQGQGKSMHIDRFPGGKADNMQPSDFNQEELQKGIAVESEHTTDYYLAIEIAMDHLAEDPKYYTNLSQTHME